jgi:hypothetical protein
MLGAIAYLDWLQVVGKVGNSEHEADPRSIGAYERWTSEFLLW